MRFLDSDIRPNQPIPLDQVRAGNTTDARWRNVPADVEVVNRVEVMSYDRS